MYSCNSAFQSKPSVVIRKPDAGYAGGTGTVITPKPADDIADSDSDFGSDSDNSGNGNVIPATLELQINKVLKTAETYTGTKHKIGGLNKKGIDCSGLVLIAYKSIDLNLPRSTGGQVNVGKSVKKEKLQKGDLVFFTYPKGKRITHVGIVSEVRSATDIEFIHTSTSRGVRKDNLNSTYWNPLLVKSRRVL
jgi:cell wall-associated NlpC family hydrolase